MVEHIAFLVLRLAWGGVLSLPLVVVRIVDSAVHGHSTILTDQATLNKALCMVYKVSFATLATCVYTKPPCNNLQ